MPPRALAALGCLALGLAASSWPSDGRAASFTVNVPPNPPQVFTYAQCASFSWNGSTLTCVPPVQNPPPTPSSGTPFEGCPDDALKIDNVWGDYAIATNLYGYFSSQILSVRVAVPSNASGTQIRTTAWAEYGTGPIAREAVFSTAACDFSGTFALRSSLGAPMKVSNVIRFNFAYSFGPATMTSVHLDPGKVYYINIRNRYSDGSLSCFQEACSMRGSLPQ
jgi:hypothetical protein